MRALVTGGTGFIGQALLKKLLNDGFSVRLVSRSSSKKPIDQVEVVVCDLTSDADLSEIAIGCDVIFHCAGELKHKDKMYSLHVEGTRKLIDAIYKSFYIDKRPKHWVQLSSVGAYGPTIKPNLPRVVTEKSACMPVGEYEITKTLSDEMLIKAADEEVMTYTILRPSIVVGSEMPNQSFGSLLRAISKKKFFFIGSKETISNYIHVDDVVDALMVCAINKRAVNQVFNLSNDCKLYDIVKKVSFSFGLKNDFLCLPEKLLRYFVKSPLNFLPLTKSRIDALVLRTSYPSTKIKNVLGYAPHRSIPEFAVEYVKSCHDKK
jgi:nucleoside-diphosphate-sugar epimerase